MSCREFMAWMIRSKRKPIGDTRADLRVGMLSAMFANAHSKKGSRRARPEHFVIGAEDPDKITDTKQMMAFFRSLAGNTKEAKRGRNASSSKRKPKG